MTSWSGQGAIATLERSRLVDKSFLTIKKVRGLQSLRTCLSPSPPTPLPPAGEGSNPYRAMNKLSCRPGCGACCIAPSISSPIPGMPQGKPAGVRCVQLDDDNRCQIFGRPERPAVCGSLQPSSDMCGITDEHAMIYLSQLERLTSA